MPARLPDLSMDRIVAAWTRRQPKIHSFHFAWQKNWTVYYRYEDDHGHRPEMHGEFQDFRSNDAAWLDHPQLAVEQIVFESPDHLNLMRVLKCAYDGESTRTYMRVSNDDPGARQVRNGFQRRHFPWSHARPLLIGLRAASPNYSGISPFHCRVLPITGKIGDVDCTILQTEGDYGEHVFYWLDPARDYLVLRSHTMAGGRDTERCDISYHRDAKAGWVPDGWTKNQLGEYGSLLSSITAKVSQYALNEPLPASTFQIKFPPGVDTFQSAP
jgi:hypothetical protein